MAREVKLKAPRKNQVGFRSAMFTIQARLVADIKLIRLRWAEGHMDSEIREELGLGFREWKRRIRVMRSVPADDDVIKSFKRYSYEHEKTVAKMSERLRELQKIYKRSVEEISFALDPKDGKKTDKKKIIVMTRPRDLGLAASVQKSMHEIDKDILKAESDFVVMKQRLDIIDMPVPAEFDPFASAETQTITAPNLMAAWKLRAQREANRKLVNATDVTEAVITANGKQAVNGKDRAKT